MCDDSIQEYTIGPPCPSTFFHPEKKSQKGGSFSLKGYFFPGTFLVEAASSMVFSSRPTSKYLFDDNLSPDWIPFQVNLKQSFNLLQVSFKLEMNLKGNANTIKLLIGEVARGGLQRESQRGASFSYTGYLVEAPYNLAEGRSSMAFSFWPISKYLFSF